MKSRSRARKFLAGLAINDVLGPPVFVFRGGTHEIIGDAHGVIGVLEKDGAVSVAIDRRVIALLDEHVRFALFLALALDEFHDIRMIDIEDHHLGGATGLAATLDHARESVKALHETDRAGSDSAARQSFLAAAQAGEIRACSGAPLEEHAFRARQAHDGFHGVFNGIDEARRALRMRLHAHVEPHRRIESHFLFNEKMGELVAESVARSIIGEVAALFSPAHNRVHDARNQLAHRTFTLRRTGLAMKIFAGDDVGGGLRPTLGNLHAFLAENGDALFVADQRGALFPFDQVERRFLAIGKIALKEQSLAGCRILLRRHIRLQ